MNKFLIAIVTSSISLLVSALKFIPGLTQAEFDSACDLGKTQLDNAKATFDQVSVETTEQAIAGMVVDGLNVAQSALDWKGDTNYDGFIQTAETFISNFETSNGHPVAAAIKTWFQKIFGKKKPA